VNFQNDRPDAPDPVGTFAEDFGFSAFDAAEWPLG
jgi:hypothetical protein